MDEICKFIGLKLVNILEFMSCKLHYNDCLIRYCRCAKLHWFNLTSMSIKGRYIVNIVCGSCKIGIFVQTEIIQLPWFRDSIFITSSKTRHIILCLDIGQGKYFVVCSDKWVKKYYDHVILYWSFKYVVIMNHQGKNIYALFCQCLFRVHQNV